MRNDEFYKIATKLRTAYPRQAIPNKETYDLWFECLKDLDYKWCDRAVVDIIKNSPYCPAIADIRKQYDTYDKRTEQERYIASNHLQR